MVRLISAERFRFGCIRLFMIHVWWALFAPFAGYSDVEVWMVHSTMSAILSLLGRLPCLSLSSLGVSNFLCALLWKTSWRNASELHVHKLRQKNQVATFLALSIQNAVRIVQALARQRRRATTGWQVARLDGR